MTAGFDPRRRDIKAPVDVAAWSPARGWHLTVDDVTAAHAIADEPIWIVTDGLIRDVVGAAALADLMLIDRRVLSAQRECAELREQLAQLAGVAVDLLTPRGDS